MKRFMNVMGFCLSNLMKINSEKLRKSIKNSLVCCGTRKKT